ncbi:MAG TPA: class I SAM-dependent methyltransferase, partial [Propylenella sp.]
LEMFDVVLCIDHSSADGTFEYLKRLEKGQPRVAVYRLDEPGYLQAAVTNHLIGAASELQGADWIFLLDADEFLPFATRAEFERAMAGFEDSPVIELPWRNLVPAAYWDYRVDLDVDFYVPDAAASHSKVALQPGRLRPGEFWIEQGNHRVAHCEGGIPVPARTAFHLWHLPVRSHLQLALKVTQGVAAYRAMGDARDAAQGEHWFRLLAQLRANTIGEGHLDRIVCSYGVPGGDLAPLSRKELAARGYRRSRLRIGRAAVEEKAALLDRDGLAALLKDMEERASAERTPETGRPVRRLETQADRVIRRAPGEAGARFPALTAFGDDPLGDDGAVPDHALIRDFLRPTYWEIDYLPPTAWAGHIPFMFAFVSTFRPRRYVELGAHWGASFFAFCQAAERVRLESSAVAIDTWQGDEHAGFYQSGVFDSFVGRLRPYASFASYLRARFDDAAKEFEDGAIDLLHIDGLHTYDAVRHDFETWLPKMSDRGTVLFHDIAVHERDFGVWQFWDELKARYPTLEFRHASGLGAAYVGSAPNTGIERFVRLLAGDAALDSLVQGHLERIAELTAALREAKAAAARSSGELDRLRA